jgi:hypothetical protein
MITLGCFDPNVTDAACKAYTQEVERTTRVPLGEIKQGVDRIALQRYTPGAPNAMGVAAVQRALKTIGFFPGGKDDGIYGYRTQSAIRLFQEYVRSVEKLPCTPDGRFGPQSQQHLQRWLDGGLVPNWAPTIERWQSDALEQGEYTDWLALLERVKAQYTAKPNRMLQMVNAFNGASDTRKPAQWDFATKQNVHLIGIRRDSASGKFDDIFVLLIKGLVFKFQGSTEPGASSNPSGTPFLVLGQHDYHFGWHQRTYLALRPQGKGVLVVRSKNDKRLDDADLANGLEANGTINIHWAGKGMARDVGSWSEGCQVINGSVYLNASNELIDCSAFAATNNGELANPQKTRGAYNVVLDLVTALGSDIAGNSVKYTLLAEQDLDLGPTLKQDLASVAARVSKIAKGG